MFLYFAAVFNNAMVVGSDTVTSYLSDSGHVGGERVQTFAACFCVRSSYCIVM